MNKSSFIHSEHYLKQNIDCLSWKAKGLLSLDIKWAVQKRILNGSKRRRVAINGSIPIELDCFLHAMRAPGIVLNGLQLNRVWYIGTCARMYFSLFLRMNGISEKMAELHFKVRLLFLGQGSFKKNI